MRSYRLPLLNPAESRDSSVLALAPNAFDPSRFQNLALYLRADAGVQSDAALRLAAASSQYLDLADSGDENSFNLDGVDFSVAFWFRLDSVGVTQAPVAKYQNSTGNRAWMVEISSSNFIGIRISDDGTASISSFVTATALSVNTWYFYSVRYDGANIVQRLYSTASLLSTTTLAYTDGVHNTTAEFVVGRRSSSTLYLNGRLDSMTIYKGKALSNSESDALWNSGAGKTHADLSTAERVGLLAWWDMNEASGSRMDSHSGGYDLTENPGTILSEVGLPAGTANDEDSVSLWLDQSSSANNASQATASLRPTLQDNLANGKPGLTFDGSDDIFSLSSGLDGSSDFLLAWVEGYTSGVSLILSRAGVANEFIRHDSATSLTVGDDLSGTAQVTHANIGTGNHISMISSESGTLTYYLDGTALALATSYTTDWFWDRVGAVQGDLLELIALNGSNPTPGRRNQLGRYLARKYALTWTPTS